jgi:ABC-type antimicrobial peptide transport system permease subunit
MALGAGRTAIARLIMRETGLLLMIGAGLGVVLSLAGGRAASTLLFGVRSYDPTAMVLALAALAVIAFIASYVPARRATRIEPVAALRAE